ncbi:MAG TPA: FAD-dependent oxidoreductase [Xanthobacteraceae bacterium]|nr:FAD-dependent oxidoreductase [Xanthobacteraceae bacterium]
MQNYSRFEGHGIHHAATTVEAKLCTGEEVVIVGGGNSAGPAAVFLFRSVAHVHILVRGGGLAATMSDYLIQRIDQSPKITLLAKPEITALEGGARLRQVGWTNLNSGATQTIACGNVFVMIGAEPITDWLSGCLELDDHGFVMTGHDSGGRAHGSPFATTTAGAFAVGDVHSGSVKRMASSVGKGSVVVSAVHQYLNEQRIGDNTALPSGGRKAPGRDDRAEKTDIRKLYYYKDER